MLHMYLSPLEAMLWLHARGQDAKTHILLFVQTPSLEDAKTHILLFSAQHRFH